MRDWTKPAATLLLALLLLGLCFYAYPARLTFNYTLDGLAYAQHVEHANPPLWGLFHPHHLLYGYLGRLLFLWGKAHGAAWDGLVALQFFGILTGAAGALLAFHLLVRETGKRWVAFFGAAGLCFSHSYWYFSTIPGVRIWATVMPLLAWYALCQLKGRSAYFGIVVGLAHGWAILGHQTNVLLIPSILGGILLLRDRNVRQRCKAAACYFVSMAALVLAVYVLVGYVAYNVRSYSGWIEWVTGYMHASQSWGGHMKHEGFSRGGTAMVSAFLPKVPPEASLSEDLSYGAAKGVLIGGLFALVAVLLLSGRRLWREQRQALWVAFSWLLAFVPFFVWWEPWNIEFWVASTVPCWILLSLAAAQLQRPWRNGALRLGLGALAGGLWAALVCLHAYYNFQGMAKKPVLNRYEFRTLLSSLDFNLKEGDLLIISGINNVHYYIDRFGPRPYLNLYAYLRKGLRKDPEAPWLGLEEDFKRRWAEKHRVYVLTEAVDEFSGARGMMEGALRLPPKRIREFFKRFKLRSVSYMGRAYIYELSPPSDGGEGTR